jgi:hypothetical protein
MKNCRIITFVVWLGLAGLMSAFGLPAFAADRASQSSLGA